MNKNISIPWLPNSIAVGLQDDLIQYCIELKFLLLFFEKPLAILSNFGFNYISVESVESIKKGKVPKVSGFEDTTLSHLDILGTDEWDELMMNCEPIYNQTTLIVSDELPNEEEFKRVDEISAQVSPLGNISTVELHNISPKSTSNEEFEDLFREYIMRLEMQRMLQTLELCQERRIPMVWGVSADIAVADLYSKFLLKQHAEKENDETMRATLRFIKGKRLLQEIFNIDIINIATVPISDIVSFRQSNHDLLESFLTKYRNFLVAVQNEPMKADHIAQTHTQTILKEMNSLRQELLILRKARKYTWLQRLSEAAYESASIGAVTAAWKLILNPIILAGKAGETLFKAATKHAGDEISKREKENALLFRSSGGYLWKAHEKFK